MVRVCEGDIYYINADYNEVVIGMCDVPNDELHIARRTNNCIVLNGLEGKYSIEAIRAGRSKKDEQWHRWASVSDSEKPAMLPAPVVKPRVIAKFHNPIGTASITGICIYRPSTKTYHYYGDFSA